MGFRHSYRQELEHFSSRQTRMGYFTPTTKALGQMFRHKYLSDTHILHTHFKPDDSCIWRAIMKVVEIMGPCFICKVGRGQGSYIVASFI